MALKRFAVISCAIGVLTGAYVHASSEQPPINEIAADHHERYITSGGRATFVFDADVLDELGFQFVVTGQLQGPSLPNRFDLEVDSTSTLVVEAQSGIFTGIVGGAVQTRGALLLDRSGDRVVIGNLTIEAGSGGVMHVESTLGDHDSDTITTFELTSMLIDFLPATGNLRLIGELTIARPWAHALGLPEAEGVVIGTVSIDADMKAVDGQVAVAESCRAVKTDLARSTSFESVPDIIVGELQSIGRYGTVRGITGFAIGTTSCNIGTARATWNAFTNQHPVIAQNLYRLKDDRFEQIGMSWVKHGFYAVSQSFCTPCNDFVDGGQELGVGCSDPYSATLNGIQTNMSPRSLINPHTGYFVFPWNGSTPQNIVERRLQVHQEDLDPVLNPQARYFIQGHYVHPDDCAAGTQNNNASYREVLLDVPSPNVFDLAIVESWQTQRGQPAVRAWQDFDPRVVETDFQVPEDGLFILAGKATDTGTGFWKYEYALQNLNSDRAAGSFSIPLPNGAIVRNPSFHDIDFHSGDIQDPTDWPAVVVDGSITWSTEEYAANVNANAVRWGTVYNFRFEVNARPDPTTITVGLFKPGLPASMAVESVGPTRSLIDCNDNGIHDLCDVSCDAPNCSQPCGEGIDCDANNVPDECQADCNENGVADTCDIDDGASLDCNENGIPDECETDCNQNTVPDDCDLDLLTSNDCNRNYLPDECEIDEASSASGGPFFCVASCDPDCDNNGVPDVCDTPVDDDGDDLFGCDDLCPDTNPGVECACGAVEDCCWFDGASCYSDLGLPPIPPAECIANGGVPDCDPSPLCRDGCLLGDSDDDGSISLIDVAGLQGCFGIDPSRGDFAECLRVFDFDDNGTVDLADSQGFIDIYHNGLP